MLRVVGEVTPGWGAWKPRMERFPEVFGALCGQRMFPGTLNVVLQRPLAMHAEFRIAGSTIGEPEQDMLFERCRVGGVECFRLRPYQPATGLGGHGDHILEIVSPRELRPLLGDAEQVEIEFPGRSALAEWVAQRVRRLQDRWRPPAPDVDPNYLPPVLRLGNHGTAANTP